MKRIRAILPVVVALAMIAPGQASAVKASSSPAARAAHVHTLGQFVRLPYRARVRFVVAYLTSHSDPCTPGHHTSRSTAQNIASSIARVKPGRDTADGSYIPVSEPIARVIKHVAANIGC